MSPDALPSHRPRELRNGNTYPICGTGAAPVFTGADEPSSFTQSMRGRI